MVVENNAIKIHVLGEGGVGKSAVTMSLIRSRFVEEYDPTIEDSYSTSRTIDGRTFTLEITDTAGQEEYRGLWQSSNLAKADAYLLVYDITSPATLEQLAYFDDLITTTTEELRNPVQKVKVIAGNKCDLASQRAISSADGLAWARTRGMGFMETSAKLKVNIEETFALIVRRVVEARSVAEQRQHVAAAPERREVHVEKNSIEENQSHSGCCRCCTIC